MTISKPTSDVVYSRSNASILSSSNLALPLSDQVIAPSDLFSALDKFFSTDTSSTFGLPNPNTTNVSFLMFLCSYFITAGETLTGVEATAYLQSILAMPLLLFQANWLNPNLVAAPDHPAKGLPPALYVSANLAKSAVRAFIPRWTVIVYTVVSVSTYFWCIGGMCFALFVQGPPTTSFELIDFASRVVSK